MGLLLDYFYSLTPREFSNVCKGYQKKEEALIKFQMILNRDLEFAMIMPHLDKKHKHLTAQKYKPFPWESDRLNEGDFSNRKFKTPEELGKIWSEIDNKNNTNE